MNLIINASLKNAKLVTISSSTLEAKTRNVILTAISSKILNINLISASSIASCQKIVNLVPLSVLLIAISRLNISPIPKNYKSIYFALFGSGFIQNANTITILKSQLLGLNPSINNTAESLLVALLNRWIYYTQHDTNGKIQVTFWGEYRINNKEVKVIELFLFNQLSKTNIYEIEPLTNIINLQNY